uniref:Putative secreted protein n=1 Tax=Xenopsylla cheopis TaxID=163159 RepID=A0A6M2DWX4_XENCH
MILHHLYLLLGCWNWRIVNTKPVIMIMQKDIVCSYGDKKVATQECCYCYLRYIFNADVLINPLTFLHWP